MDYVPPIGKTGLASYVDADPANGIEGDAVSSDAWEHSMLEIRNVIETFLGEDTASGNDLTQLAQAISQAVADGAVSVENATEDVAGIVERATDAEAAAGTDATRYITAKQLNDNAVVVSEKSSRTTTGTWTITGLTVGKPIFLTVSGYSGDNGIFEFRVTAGSNDGGAGNGVDFRLGPYSNGSLNSSCSAVIVPTSSTVSIEVAAITSGVTARVYQ